MNILDSLDSYLDSIDVTSVRLKLGSFQFKEFEIPEKIDFPGEMKIVPHLYVGGTKTIDVLGMVYDKLSWSGIITGSKSASRVKALELMRDQGKVVTLTLDDISFDVLVTNFTPTYAFEYRRPYSITVEVLKRNDSPKRVDALTGALNALIGSDVGKALGLADYINVASITSAVESIQSAVLAVSDFATATTDTVQTVLTPIAAARSIYQTTILSLESSMNQITSLGGLVPGNTVQTTVSNVLTQSENLTSLTYLRQLDATTARLEKNVQAGNTADGVKSITVSGGTLYGVAAVQYGDPTLWTTIAAANNLTDPQLNGITTLVIPANPNGDDS